MSQGTNDDDYVHVYVSRITHLQIRSPWGAETFQYDDDVEEDEVREIEADPMAAALRLLGVTREQYLEWLDADGVPLCSETKKDGQLCQRRIKGSFTAAEWVAAHRRLPCPGHQAD